MKPPERVTKGNSVAAEEAGAVAVSAADYLYFVRRAVDGMVDVVRELGDERAARRPDLPGANTPYGLLTHCLGVIEYWGGRLVAGRAITRDRLAEFAATGSVDELVERAAAALAQLAQDVAMADSGAALRNEPDAWAEGPDQPLTQGAALLHLYEELAQHHGQMQVLRDALVAADPGRPYDPPIAWLRAKRGVKWRRPGPELLPAWVADMDFPVAPAIRSALVQALDRGDVGYPGWPDASAGRAVCRADARPLRLGRRSGTRPRRQRSHPGAAGRAVAAGPSRVRPSSPTCRTTRRSSPPSTGWPSSSRRRCFPTATVGRGTTTASNAI